MPAVLRWLAIAAAGAVLAAGIWAGVPYLSRVGPLVTRLRQAVAPPAPAAPTNATADQPTVGALQVNSTPAGARILVDGKERGVTPLTVVDLRPGVHELTLASGAGTVHRKFTVAAGGTTAIDESIFPGWVTVLAPFDVEVSEGGSALRVDERHQIMLPPGPHDLRLSNASLDYVMAQQVDVKPGAVATVRVVPPASTLTVTAAEPSEVWLDGTRIGQTPLNAVPARLGTHELVIRRAAREQRVTVTIGTKPFTLNADSMR